MECITHPSNIAMQRQMGHIYARALFPGKIGKMKRNLSAKENGRVNPAVSYATGATSAHQNW